MSEGNVQLIKALLWMVGINVLINILPSPFGLIAMGGFFLWFLIDLYKNTRY